MKRFFLVFFLIFTTIFVADFFFFKIPMLFVTLSYSVGAAARRFQSTCEQVVAAKWAFPRFTALTFCLCPEECGGKEKKTRSGQLCIFLCVFSAAAAKGGLT